tara:strand:- start:162 stop:449 length:288 start_codon:yes stop_codon:yes gene_type:complete
MRNLLFILLLGLGFTQSLIENVTKSYDDGMPKEIKYYKSISNKIELFTAKGYYENGQIRYETKYRDGKKDGKWTSYYYDGQISVELYYKDGVIID